MGQQKLSRFFLQSAWRGRLRTYRLRRIENCAITWYCSSMKLLTVISAVRRIRSVFYANPHVMAFNWDFTRNINYPRWYLMSPGVYEWIGGCFGGMSIITIIKRMCAWILRSELSILGAQKLNWLSGDTSTNVGNGEFRKHVGEIKHHYRYFDWWLMAECEESMSFASCSKVSPLSHCASAFNPPSFTCRPSCPYRKR